MELENVFFENFRWFEISCEKRGRFFGDKFLSHEEDKVFTFRNFFLLIVTKEGV